jgi:hypothetical protein
LDEKSFFGFIAAIAVICSFVISCYNGIGNHIDGVNNETLEYSPSADVAALLKKTSVRLFDGVTIETGTNQPSYEAASAAIKEKAKAGTYVDQNRTDAISVINGINADTLVYIKPDSVAY